MKLLLHIGQPKTGSSYLQSALSLGTDILARHGISYPIAAEIAEKARAGRITSGNFWPREGALEQVIEAGRRQGLPTLLISSESLFQLISAPKSGFLEDLQAICPEAELHVLCYLRDPVDHAVSVYQQKVKRGGFSGTLSQALEQYSAPNATVRALSRLRAAGATTTVYNYSRHRAELLATFERWLGLPEGVTLPKPAVEQVNRSLTRAEIELQKAFNRHFGQRARQFVSDPLCDEIPDIPSETPALNQADLARFLDRMSEQVSDPAYLELVPEAERPKIGSVETYANRFPAEDQDAPLSFTARQIGVFAEAMCKELEKVAALRRQLQQARSDKR